MITKYAGVSCYGTFLAAIALSYFSLGMWPEFLLKTMVLLFLLHMTIYSFVMAFSAKRTHSKILLILFSILFPVMSGFTLYFIKGFGAKSWGSTDNDLT